MSDGWPSRARAQRGGGIAGARTFAIRPPGAAAGMTTA
jgi:hypothetical protein